MEQMMAMMMVSYLESTTEPMMAENLVETMAESSAGS